MSNHLWGEITDNQGFLHKGPAVLLVFPCHDVVIGPMTYFNQGPLLLTWFNFNPSMDK